MQATVKGLEASATPQSSLPQLLSSMNYNPGVLRMPVICAAAAMKHWPRLNMILVDKKLALQCYTCNIYYHTGTQATYLCHATSAYVAAKIPV